MRKIFSLLVLMAAPVLMFAAGTETTGPDGISIMGIRLEFILFALTLVGVAIFHNHTLYVAITGLVLVLLVRLLFTDFDIVVHAEHEWQILLNLFGLLIGFAVLAKHSEESGVPDHLPKLLPGNWMGPFLLLVMIFVLSSFLDNIAAALIGGSIALIIFKGKVHIGYLAAIVAASNAGGSGSVVGDTTTTMMWIDGITPGQIVHAYVAAVPALMFFGIFAARQQYAMQPIIKEEVGRMEPIKPKKIVVVALILAGAIITNLLLDFPAAGVWGAIILGSLFVSTPWKEVLTALPGSAFLMCLVLCASLMPVETLPPASWVTAFVLGFISSVFDNIPLTKLALEQSNYDWGLLAYAVGFGGSMIWFGSSAGVAITNLFPSGKSVANWVKYGWHVAVAYVIGFFILYGTLGWHPFHHLENQTPQATESHP